MTAVLARAVMRLARHCLGPGRGDWGAAMQAEFAEAARDGKPLAFATGCLLAAWRATGLRDEDRAVLTNYALAVVMLIPMAALHLSNGLDLSAPYSDVVANRLLADDAAGNPYLTVARTSAKPLVALLWLFLAAAHVGLAWALVAQDRTRIVKSGAAIGASTITLAVVAAVLMLDLSALIPQLAGLAVECVAIGLVARRNRRTVRIPFA